MIAIAWVDTTEGRRWLIGRGATLICVGILGWTIGRLIGPWAMWGGVGIVVFGAGMVVRALVHPNRGLPLAVPASKPCVVQGCDGTMHFHAALPVADGAHTLEWAWRPSWRCAKDSAHAQLIGKDEEREIVSRTFGRLAKDSAQFPPAETTDHHSPEDGTARQPRASPPRA